MKRGTMLQRWRGGDAGSATFHFPSGEKSRFILTPANLFAPGFIGSAKMNLIESVAAKGEIRFATNSKVSLPVGMPLAEGKCHLAQEHLANKGSAANLPESR